MALTITAVADPTTYSVRLTVKGGTPEYTVQAAPAADRDSYTVRTAWSKITGDASGRVGVDGEVPLNTATVYVVTDATGAQAQAGPVTVDASLPVLSDAMDPSKARTVVVVSQPPNDYQGRSVWWDILGRTDPYASTAPLRLRAGDVVLYLASRAERRAILRDLLAAGNPLVLRAVCPDAVDDLVMLVERARDELVDATAPSGDRLLRLTYQAISRDLGPYAVDPQRTYADLLVEAATYADLLVRYTSYDALLAGDPFAGLDVELLTNRDFAAGSTGWDTFWSITTSWTFAGSALGTATAAASLASLQNTAVLDLTIPASRMLRVSGRVRSTGGGVVPQIDCITTTAVPPGYFQPGSSIGSVTLPGVGAAWTTFAVDVPMPSATDTRATVYFRAAGMPAGAVVEFDDLSVRWKL